MSSGIYNHNEFKLIISTYPYLHKFRNRKWENNVLIWKISNIVNAEGKSLTLISKGEKLPNDIVKKTHNALF